MQRAQRFVLAWGGLERTRVFTRIWLALFGLWSWDDLPNMPPEMIFLPHWFPLNVYDWACWARQTVVPLTIVATLRPVRPLPFGIDELRSGATPAAARATAHLGRGVPAPRRRAAPLRAAPGAPAAPPRDAPRRRVDPRPAGGRRLLGRHPAAVGVLAARPAPARLLRSTTRRCAPASPGLDGFLVREETPDGWVRRLEACQSPVWDTCLAVTALLDAGVAPDDPDVVRAAGWMLDEEIARPGRLGGAPARPGPRRLGVRVRQRRLPGHRRHRRDRAGAAPGRAPATRAGSAAPWTGASPGPSGCSRATAAGARSTRTTPGS